MCQAAAACCSTSLPPACLRRDKINPLTDVVTFKKESSGFQNPTGPLGLVWAGFLPLHLGF